MIRVPALKWAVGLFLFLGAGAMFLLALGWFFWAQSEEKSAPLEVTAAELIDLPNRGPMPDPWLSYTFSKYCETGVRMDLRSVGNQYAYSRFILVQVQDRWLVAQVPPDFRGNKLVGTVERLGSYEGRSYESHLDKQIVIKILASNRDKADRLLPYQVDAVRPYLSKIRGGYTMAAGIVLGGLIVGGLGLTIIRVKPQPR